MERKAWNALHELPHPMGVICADAEKMFKCPEFALLLRCGASVAHPLAGTVGMEFDSKSFSRPMLGDGIDVLKKL